jgi:nitrite reductase (NADH) small subunit
MHGVEVILGGATRGSLKTSVVEFFHLSSFLQGVSMPFVLAAKIVDVPAGSIHEIQVAGKAVALANVAGKFFAINNTCLHRGGPLGQGSLQDKVVTCPWHGWEYDVTTGKLLHNPSMGVACYPTEVRGEEVFVDIA